METSKTPEWHRAASFAITATLVSALALAPAALAEGEGAADVPATQEQTQTQSDQTQGQTQQDTQAAEQQVASAVPSDAQTQVVAKSSGRLVKKAAYYHYDAKKKKWVKDSSCAYSYDAAGNLKSMGTEKVSYKLNANGSKKSCTRVDRKLKIKYGPYFYNAKGRIVKVGKKKPAKYTYSKQGYVKKANTYSSSKRKYVTDKISYKYYKNGLAKKSTTYNSFNGKKERVTSFNSRGLPTKVTMYDASKVNTVTTYTYTYAANGLVKSCEKKTVFKKNKRLAPYRSKVSFKYSSVETNAARYSRMMGDVLDSSRIELNVIQWL